MPAFNAFEWSGTANPDWSVDGNMWAPDVVYNKEMKKWCMYLSINGDSWYSSIIMLTSDFIVGPYTYQAPVVISGFKSGDTYKLMERWYLHVGVGREDRSARLRRDLC